MRVYLYAALAALTSAATPAVARDSSTVIVDNGGTYVVHRSDNDIRNWKRDDYWGSQSVIIRDGRRIVIDDDYRDDRRGPNCNRGRKTGNPHC